MIYFKKMEIKAMTSSDEKNLKNKEKIPTFDEVWQILKESAKQQEQRSKRLDEDIKKSRIEFDKQMKESQIAFDKKMNKMRGIWSNAWGDFVESLVSGNLVKMLQEWIPSINMIMKNIEGQRNGYDCEFDIIAINNEALVATEVKSTLSVKDVKDFLEKLKNFSMFLPQFKNYKVYGAVAYLKVTQGAEKFAMKQGLFVIRATGDSGEILNKKDSFEPKAIKQIN